MSYFSHMQLGENNKTNKQNPANILRFDNKLLTKQKTQFDLIRPFRMDESKTRNMKSCNLPIFCR